MAEGDHIIVRESANIRGNPSMQSPVVRVVQEGMELRVFARSGPWLQVGDSFAWGWINRAAAGAAP